MPKSALLAWTLAATLLVGGTLIAQADSPKMAGPDTIRSWTHTKSMVIPDQTHGLYGFHHVYANELALPISKSGGTYPEGAALGVVFYEVVQDGGIVTQGAKRQSVMMVKDPKSATGGWVYSAFGADGKPLAIDPATACHECHTQVKDADFVFSRYVD